MKILVCCVDNKSSNFNTTEFIEYKNKNFTNYKKEYDLIQDTLYSWIKDSLVTTKRFLGNSWQVDSVICINSDSTRLFTTVNNRIIGWKGSRTDWIYGLAGARIKGKWYFLLMASDVIDRSVFQDSIYSPLTFEELSYIAHTRIFPQPIKDSVTGALYFDERFFDQLFSLQKCKGEKAERKCQEEEIVERNQFRPWNYKNRYLDKEEIAEIKEEMAKSVRPPEPEKSWWDKWFGPTKVFESEEWKNRKEKGI